MHGSGQLTKSLMVFGPREPGGTAACSAGRDSPNQKRLSQPRSLTKTLSEDRDPKRIPSAAAWISDDLPLVENPQRLLATPRDDLDPAGFGPLAASWSASCRPCREPIMCRGNASTGRGSLKTSTTAISTLPPAISKSRVSQRRREFGLRESSSETPDLQQPIAWPPRTVFSS